MTDMRLNVLKIGIASTGFIKARTFAVARGQRKRRPDDPLVWFTSINALAQVLSEPNRLLLELIRKARPSNRRREQKRNFLQRQNHRYPDVSKALMQAGEAYTKAAKPTLAADRFYRAAASFTAQEKSAIALQAINFARLAATQAGDVPLTHLIDDLNAEIKMMPATQPAVR